MFLYIPGGEQLDFFYSITSFLWFSFTSPTPHTLNTWSNPNHHLLNWPNISTDSKCTKQGIRYQYFLRQITLYIVKLSGIMTKFYEMLHQTPNSPETRPIPWSLRRWHGLGVTQIHSLWQFRLGWNFIKFTQGETGVIILWHQPKQCTALISGKSLKITTH